MTHPPPFTGRWGDERGEEEGTLASRCVLGAIPNGVNVVPEGAVQRHQAPLDEGLILDFRPGEKKVALASESRASRTAGGGGGRGRDTGR